MKNKAKETRANDEGLIERFIAACADGDMTIQQVGDSVGKTKAWASLIVQRRIKTLKWQTANRIKRFLGEAQ